MSDISGKARNATDKQTQNHWAKIQVELNMMRLRTPIWLALPVLLTACAPAVPPAPDPLSEPGVLSATRNGPPGAPEGTCWGKTVSPAVVQTVEEQVQIKPAQVNPDGTIAAPPKYRRSTRQEIVTPRKDNWFETPCAEVMTPEFIATLQRALAARGLYEDEITSVMDAPTRTAVQAFQRLDGRDSPVLTLATARTLGLIAVARTPTE